MLSDAFFFFHSTNHRCPLISVFSFRSARLAPRPFFSSRSLLLYSSFSVPHSHLGCRVRTVFYNFHCIYFPFPLSVITKAIIRIIRDWAFCLQRRFCCTYHGIPIILNIFSGVSLLKKCINPSEIQRLLNS
jgi:hypothetical protein